MTNRRLLPCMLFCSLLVLLGTAAWAATPTICSCSAVKVVPPVAGTYEGAAAPESESGAELPLATLAVLWDQLNPSSVSYASQDFEPAYDAYDIYAADDFQNTQAWTINKITTQGGWGVAVDLHNASAIHWFIYADNAGKPAGVPGVGLQFWTITLAPTDPQITLSGLDVVLNLTTPINLPTGTWWLIFYPSLNYSSYGQYGWQSTLNAVWGQAGKLNNPGGGFGMPAGWNDTGASTDFSFRLEGTTGGGGGYDLSFVDDLGRSSLCLNSTSGSYLWKILKGTGAGTSYTGTGHVTQTATLLTLTNVAGAPQRISLNYYKVSKSASGYCQSSAQYSCLVDANTANDPPCQ